MQGKHGNGLSIIHYAGDTVKFQFNENSYGSIIPWTERNPNGSGSVSNPVSDRRSVGSIGPYNLNPGNVLQLDIAYIYSRSDTGDNLSSVNTLQQEIPLVQSFYNDSIPTYCTDSILGEIGVNELLKDNIAIYPNPFLASFEVKTIDNSDIASLELFDSFGKTIYNKQGKFNSSIIDTKCLSKGLYYVKISDNKNNFYVKKIIKQ